MKQADLIREEYKDSDGYWVYLIKGYQYDDRHTIHESTKRQAYRCLRDVSECCCETCNSDKYEHE